MISFRCLPDKSSEQLVRLKELFLYQQLGQIVRDPGRHQKLFKSYHIWELRNIFLQLKWLLFISVFISLQAFCHYLHHAFRKLGNFTTYLLSGIYFAKLPLFQSFPSLFIYVQYGSTLEGSKLAAAIGTPKTVKVMDQRPPRRRKKEPGLNSAHE